MPIRFFLALGLILSVSPALAAEGKKEKETKTFVAIETLTATARGDGGRHRVMTVQGGLDIQDPALHAYAESVQPRLRDALAQTLETYAAGLPVGAVPDVDYLGRQLQVTADRVLKKPGSKILLGGVMVN